MKGKIQWWVIITFSLVTFIFAFLRTFLPDPLIQKIIPTFLWNFSNFWYIAFLELPFSILFWGIVIVIACTFEIND